MKTPKFTKKLWHKKIKQDKTEKDRRKRKAPNRRKEKQMTQDGEQKLLQKRGYQNRKVERKEPRSGAQSR